METKDALLIALVTALAIAAIYHLGGWGHEGFAGGAAAAGGCKPGATVHQRYPCPRYNPYTVLNKQLDSIRGYRNDGYGQPPFYRHPRGLDAYHRAGAHLRPEDVAEAERMQWFTATSADCSGSFNTELCAEPTTDVMQYHSAAPAIDYNSYVTDLIVDPRTADNHRRWVEEMKPWSGTAMKVDTLDMENYIDFQGLRRPQAVVQYNPLQLTEIDTFDLSVNKPFRFQG